MCCSNAVRQAKFRKQMLNAGFVQATVWVPVEAIPDLRLQAEILRDQPHLAVGPLRNPNNGRYVKLRQPLKRPA